jgi:hypothetical protein
MPTTDLLLVAEAMREHLLHLLGDDFPTDQLEIAATLCALDELNRDLAEARRQLADVLGDTMGPDVLTGDGWQAEKRWATSRTRWQNDALWAALRPRILRRVLDPADTGEVIGDPDTVVRTLDEVLALANVSGSSMRVTRLREMGLDPDEWCESQGRWTATVKRLDGSAVNH